MPKVYNHRNSNVPTDAVNIDRSTRYGNRFHIGPDGTREEVIAKHKAQLLCMPKHVLTEFLMSLRGKDLVCWCKPKDCHGDTYRAALPPNKGDSSWPTIGFLKF